MQVLVGCYKDREVCRPRSASVELLYNIDPHIDVWEPVMAWQQSRNHRYNAGAGLSRYNSLSYNGWNRVTMLLPPALYST